MPWVSARRYADLLSFEITASLDKAAAEHHRELAEKAEERVAIAERHAEEWRAAAVTAQTAHAGTQKMLTELMDRFTTLRLAGAVEPPPPLPPRQPKDAIDRAFDEAMKGQPQNVREAGRRQLAEDRKLIEMGAFTETDLVAKIRLGERNSAEGVPDDDTVSVADLFT